eukprot:gene24158-9745_t
MPHGAPLAFSKHQMSILQLFSLASLPKSLSKSLACSGGVEDEGEEQGCTTISSGCWGPLNCLGGGVASNHQEHVQVRVWDTKKKRQLVLHIPKYDAPALGFRFGSQRVHLSKVDPSPTLSPVSRAAGPTWPSQWLTQRRGLPTDFAPPPEGNSSMYSGSRLVMRLTNHLIYHTRVYWSQQHPGSLVIATAIEKVGRSAFMTTDACSTQGPTAGGSAQYRSTQGPTAGGSTQYRSTQGPTAGGSAQHRSTFTPVVLEWSWEYLILSTGFDTVTVAPHMAGGTGGASKGVVSPFASAAEVAATARGTNFNNPEVAAVEVVFHTDGEA